MNMVHTGQKVGETSLLRTKSRLSAIGVTSALPHEIVRLLISREQHQIVLNIGIGRVLLGRKQKRRARFAKVAAQHVGISLIVQDLRRRTDDAGRLLVGAIGQFETAQAIIGSGETEPGFRIGSGRSCRLFDRAPEMLLSQPIVHLGEMLSAEPELVGGIDERSSLPDARLLTSGGRITRRQTGDVGDGRTRCNGESPEAGSLAGIS